MATIASLIVNILGDSTALSASLKSATDKMQSFANQATSLGQTLSTRLTLPLIGAGTLMVKSFMTQEDAVAKMNGALRANAGQAGVTAKEIEDLASSLQKVTTFGDEVTISAASLLLTFHNIRNEVGEGNDVFNRTIKASQDLASAMGTDLRSATMQLAKALENPTIGLGALARSGTTFTEQQKEMIKTLVDSGRQLEAQTMILDVVESQYSGIAETMRKTTSGTIKGAVNELGDQMEVFGKIISEALIPFINRITDAVRFIATLDEGSKRFIVTLGAFAAGIGPVIYGVGILTSGIRALTIVMATNPYFAFALALTAIASATFMAIKGVNDLEKALLKQAGIESLTGSQEERNKLLAEEKIILADLASARGRLTRAESANAKSSEEGKIERYKAQLNQIDQTIAKSNVLAFQNYELGKSAREASEASEKLKNLLGGVTTEVVNQAGSIGALTDELKALQAQFEATGDGVERAKFADKIRELESQITALRASLTKATAELRMLNEMGMAGDDGFDDTKWDSTHEGVKIVTTQMKLLGDASLLANEMALQFTNQFSAGLANLIVHGGKLKDMLRNIGNLLASSALQLGIQMLLMSATGQGGGFGFIKGLFGGSPVSAVPTNVMGAGMVSVSGQFKVQGTDLIAVINRSERQLR